MLNLFQHLYSLKHYQEQGLRVNLIMVTPKYSLWGPETSSG